MTNRALPLAATLIVSACFNPNVPSGDEGGTESGTGTDANDSTADAAPSTMSTSDRTTTAPATTLGPDTDTGTSEGDDTSSMDDPPIVESFTVNGSTTPAEVNAGGLVLLEALATDDLGVASVEFFDGDESLAVVEEEPYTLEQLVTSADTGSHVYRAVVTDTEDQTAQSEEVTLSVNIVGGAVEFLREQLFAGAEALAGSAELAAIGNNRVYVAGLVAGGTEGHAIAFNEDLSQIWESTLEEGSYTSPVETSAGILISTWGADSWSYIPHSPSTGNPSPALTFDLSEHLAYLVSVGPSVAIGGEGVVLATNLNRVATYDEDLVAAGWSLDLPDSAWIDHIYPVNDGDVLVRFNADEECVPGSTHCIMRIRADGSPAWTSRARGSAVAVLEDGSVVMYDDTGSGALEATTLNPDGSDDIVSQVADDSHDYSFVADAAPDGSGGTLVVGTFDNNGSRRAIVSRFDADLQLVWQQDDIAEDFTSMGFAVDATNDAVFVCGIEDVALEVFGTTGDAWAAKLSL